MKLRPLLLTELYQINADLGEAGDSPLKIAAVLCQISGEVAPPGRTSLVRRRCASESTRWKER
jgi:hypothetical protein